jgi:hypothetical protein
MFANKMFPLFSKIQQSGIALAKGEFEPLHQEVEMFRDKKVIVVMPAYNAERTLRMTYDEVVQQGIVDLVIMVDDASQGATAATRNLVTNWLSSKGATSSLWSTLITSTRPN